MYQSSYVPISTLADEKTAVLNKGREIYEGYVIILVCAEKGFFDVQVASVQGLSQSFNSALVS